MKFFSSYHQSVLRVTAKSYVKRKEDFLDGKRILKQDGKRIFVQIEFPLKKELKTENHNSRIKEAV